MSISIKYGSSIKTKNKYLQSLISNNKDSLDLIITDSNSIFSLEQFLSTNSIHCKCLDIKSAYSYFFDNLGYSYKKVCPYELSLVAIANILKENKSSLNFFTNENTEESLSSQVFALINEFDSNNIFPETIENLLLSHSEITGPFYNKINDLKFIYNKYIEFLNKNNFILNSEQTSIIKSFDKPVFSNIIVDFLSKYTINTIELLASLGKISKNVTIFIRTPFSSNEDSYITKNLSVIDNIIQNCDKNDIFVQKENFEQENIFSDPSDFDIIENNFFKMTTTAVSSSDCVKLYEATNPKNEIEYVSSEIKKLVDDGVSYDDIAITTPAISKYLSLIQNNFSINNIPYFYHKEGTLLETSLSGFLINTLSLCEDFSFDVLMDNIYLNYFDIDFEKISVLDTFYKRFGSNLATALKNGQLYDNESYNIVFPIINSLKNEIETLESNLINAETISEKLVVLFDYLYLKNVPAKLNNEVQELEKNNENSTCNEIINEWNYFVDVCETINKFLGTNKASVEEFKNIIISFAKEKKIVNKYKYYNQVSIISLGSATGNNIKYLFIIGCNDNNMFKTDNYDIFSEKEKMEINTLFKSNIKTHQEVYDFEIYKFYLDLTAPEKQLFLTWSKFDLGFNALSIPSYISRINQLFPSNLTTEENYHSSLDETKFISFLCALNSYVETGIKAPDFDDTFKYFKSHTLYKSRLFYALKNIKTDKRKFNIKNPELYCDLNTFSVTRLETYNECAFKHFVKFAIKPKEQKMFQETVANKGSFYHMVFFEFYNKIIDEGIDIQSITKEDVSSRITAIIDNYLENHNDNVLNSSDKFKYIANQMKETSIISAWNSVQQLKVSTFRPKYLEHDIGEKIPFTFNLASGDKVNISGISDRIDVANINGQDYARIIDYKSGSTTFDLTRFSAGLQLQLPLYLLSISEEYTPAGMYYYKVFNPVEDIDNPLYNSQKDFTLSGFTLEDDDVLTATDSTLASTSSCISNVVNVARTAKGELTKSSKVFSKTEMDNFLNEAKYIAEETINMIKTGETSAIPTISSSKSPCEYCKYKSFCHFDPTLPDSFIHI